MKIKDLTKEELGYIIKKYSKRLIEEPECMAAAIRLIIEESPERHVRGLLELMRKEDEELSNT